MTELSIAEIPYESGSIRFRYSRKLSSDETFWIREGLFRAYHPNGTIATEGHYVDGVEDGLWRDYHENGRLAAEGTYRHGSEGPDWHYWDADGGPTDHPERSPHGR